MMSPLRPFLRLSFCLAGVHAFAKVASGCRLPTTVHHQWKVPSTISMDLSSARPSIQILAQAPIKTVAAVSGPAAFLGKMITFFKSRTIASFAVATLIVTTFAVLIQRILWKPSRTYNQEENTVGKEYDAWATEGILESYWGEHIHLGYYNDEERTQGYKKKNFIQAKYDFIDEMMKFGKVGAPKTILDVGCGIGGTSRYLAKKLGTETSVTGITLSPQQVLRAKTLASERGITNTDFVVMDALKMTFPDNIFDLVWACESGEHMPDKKLYVEEMTRVLKPGGRIIIATWCQRDDSKKPFNAEDRKMLDFLYAEWTHPYFISIEEYARLMLGTGKLETVVTDDWAVQTIPSWRHSIWVGVYNPLPVLRRPWLWWKCLRDGITLERMHLAFTSGLMQYGMMTAVKK